VINRITKPLITKIGLNEVFVFGSNESGIHGAGAARTAMSFGAIRGKGVGHYGNTYAIPTVAKNISGKLPLATIQTYVNDFIEYAKAHPEFKFLVTMIGCGLAGYNISSIAPLFKGAVSVNNIHLPKEFWNVLNKQEKS